MTTEEVERFGIALTRPKRVDYVQISLHKDIP